MVYAIERMIDEIVEKAREEGEKTGREAEKEEMVKNLLALGVSVETIQEASGMSLDKIERLHGGD
jgi:predicted transposase/invertase (TIGR01784 family)